MIKQRYIRTVDLPRALQHVGIDRSRFNYLHGHGRRDGTKDRVLQTEFSEPAGGAARRISIENLLELDFLEAATSLGFNLYAAVHLTQRWLKEWRAGSLGEWFVRAGEGDWGNAKTYFSDATTKVFSGDATLASIAETLNEPGTRSGSVFDAHMPESPRFLRAINLREIARRGDGLLSSFGEDTAWQTE